MAVTLRRAFAPALRCCSPRARPSPSCPPTLRIQGRLADEARWSERSPPRRGGDVASDNDSRERKPSCATSSAADQRPRRERTAARIVHGGPEAHRGQLHVPAQFRRPLRLRCGAHDPPMAERRRTSTSCRSSRAHGRRMSTRLRSPCHRDARPASLRRHEERTLPKSARARRLMAVGRARRRAWSPRPRTVLAADAPYRWSPRDEARWVGGHRDGAEAMSPPTTTVASGNLVSSAPATAARAGWRSRNLRRPGGPVSALVTEDRSRARTNRGGDDAIGCP